MNPNEPQVVIDNTSLVNALNNLVKLTNEISTIIMTNGNLSEKDYQAINSSLQKIIDKHKSKPKKPEFPPPRVIKEDFI